MPCMLKLDNRDPLQLVIWANHESLLVIGPNDSSRTEFKFVFMSEQLVSRDTPTSVLCLDTLRNFSNVLQIEAISKAFSYTKE